MLQEELCLKLLEFSQRSRLDARGLDDIKARFEALRCCGRIARGKQKYTERLSVDQIVDCVLALSTPNPNFGGFASIVLRQLRPVGGVSASFFQQPTFGRALAHLLTYQNSLKQIVDISTTTSEIFNNSNGRAKILFNRNGRICSAHFVSSMASSLLGQGAERKFSEFEHIGGLIEEFHFPQSLWSQLFGAMKASQKRIPARVSRFFEREDRLEGRAANRAKRLGISPGAEFMNRGVSVQAEWPKYESVVSFGGFKIVLLPQTKTNSSSLHIDLNQDGLGEVEATRLLNEFLSILTWCWDQPAVLQEGFTGNPIPVPLKKGGLASASSRNWIFARSRVKDIKLRKALALYREGRIAQQNYLVLFSVLSFYKVFETKLSKSDIKKWINEHYLEIAKSKIDRHILGQFENFRGAQKAGDYLENAGRHAVAHARDEGTSDPDDASELRRLHVLAEIFRVLSREMIMRKFGYSDSVLSSA
jgi:hypothetical protein